MILATLFSTLCLLTSPQSIPSTIPSSQTALPTSIDTIKEHCLETIEGRNRFLTDKLSPYAAKTALLNQEIETLASRIKNLSPENDKMEIVRLTNEMLEKMTELTNRMTVLNLTATLEHDFEQIPLIVQQTEPLTKEQQEIVDRIAALCRCVV